MTSIRVRFAPSPTGYLHIGGARTALYNMLLAKAKGGTFILRVEDTDDDRSERRFEELQIQDLKWLGIEFDEGPGVGGNFGPYRQSERLDIYMKYTLELIERGLAYYDFCTEEELEVMRIKAEAEGTPPYTGKWREEKYFAEAKARVAAGEKTSIRFKVDASKNYDFHDLVRGHVKFPSGMVGDFVIMRSNGIPTFNYCNVIDDHLFAISHVLRGEEHLNNTVRQLMIYEAFNWAPPVYAHLSIMIGHDRQKLSKRHGATSVNLYKEEGYLPEALNNYLCLLGWSHPEEKSIFKKEDLIPFFDEKRFNASPAMYDIEKLKWTNSQHLRLMSADDLLKHAKEVINKDHYFHTQPESWQRQCLELYKEKISLIKEIETKVDEEILKAEIEINDTLKDILSWETTPQIGAYLKTELAKIEAKHVEGTKLDQWMEHCKVELKIKGKPLFMGFRACLTGHDHGPDLKVLIPLTSTNILKQRLNQLFA